MSEKKREKAFVLVGIDSLFFQMNQNSQKQQPQQPQLGQQQKKEHEMRLRNEEEEKKRIEEVRVELKNKSFEVGEEQILLLRF